ncbi:MAG: hypothetical protein ACI867_002273 [Glaciecola sp.]
MDENIAKSTLNVLLKYQQDIEKAGQHLKMPPPDPSMN